ncbi:MULTISPECIES: hypothetical protein [Sphingomonas]|uniref:hypothetical protein n=1 Tax=Sphingomonas TaxID=13687 RepID=UPI000DEEB389|nr:MULTISPECIES: hypothetical protein [Sphingomonas]
MIAMLLALAGATPAATPARAVALAQQAMKSIDPTTPIVCLAFDPEKSTPTRIDLVVREVHDYKCGGEDDVEVVREHFRVARKPVGISRLDPKSGRYLACTLAKNSVTCPAPVR